MEGSFMHVERESRRSGLLLVAAVPWACLAAAAAVVTVVARDPTFAIGSHVEALAATTKEHDSESFSSGEFAARTTSTSPDEGGIAGTPACGDETLTQSATPGVITSGGSLACLLGLANREYSLARSFTIDARGLTVGCVAFGIEFNVGPAWPVQVRLRTGDAITGPYAELTVVAETTIQIPADSGSAFYVAEFPSGVTFPSGSTMVVELYSASRVIAEGGDGGRVIFGCNSNGQAAPTYVRGPLCGVPNFINAAAVGFPDSHLALTVHSAAMGCGSGGSCFKPHATPGCDGAACCEQVCAVDPVCCTFTWDVACAKLAAALCEPAPPAPDLVRNITPAAWQAEVVDWVRDAPPYDGVAPGNGVDYLIDESADPSFDIVVNLKRCIDPDFLAFLQTTSPGATIQRLGKYITYIAMSGCTKSEVIAIAAHPSVAFVERQITFYAGLDISVPTIKVTSSSTYSPNTVQDALPGINGAGVNIAILDTGVDNHQHLAFAGTPVVGFYNAVTGMAVDPDDDHGHGTHVAATALGRPFAGGFRGVAPGAGLIDVKVLHASGVGTWPWIIDGIEEIYDNRAAWNVGVMNLSIWTKAASDGKEAMCQLLDLSDNMGICVVTIAGNGGPLGLPIGAPGSASRAFTIAASDDLGTVQQPDPIAVLSTRGPRLDNGNGSTLDELKPELAAPGIAIEAAAHDTTTGIVSLSGTSMAAPHVAGVIALMKQADPSLNCATIRCRLISTAQQLSGYLAWNPAIDPIWNEASGWGLVDAWAAVTMSTTGPDIKFPSHPPNPIWLSPDIGTTTAPQVGVPTQAFAKILNPSANPVPNVLVQFGVHVYSAATPTFHDIGSEVRTLSPGVNHVKMPWTPALASHQCLKVSIGHCTDPDTSNNQAQRNLTVAQSPVTFQIRNTLSLEPRRIEFHVDIPEGKGWTVDLEPPEALLAGEDCPIDVVALPIPPVGTPDGTQVTIHIGAFIGDVPLDGVSILATMRDCNKNGMDDYIDILHMTSHDVDGDGIPDECQQCPADLNADGIVDGNDLAIILGSWNPLSCPACPADINGDGVVDGNDLAVLLGAWGPCP